MWKPGGQDICTSDSMEVVPSRSNIEDLSDDFLDAASHHSLLCDEPDIQNQSPGSTSPSTNFLPPSEAAGELRQKSTPNILSWVAEQQQVARRLNNAPAPRRPQSVRESRRPRPEEYEKAAEEIMKIRRQCGM